MSEAEQLPFVRIVVLTFDGGDMTLRCLRSLAMLDWPTDRLEIVLVDNGSLDDVAEQVKRDFPTVIVLEPLANLGFAGGCNLGIMHGIDGAIADQIDHIALINNDATVDSDWLRALVAAMDTDPRVAGVASKMLFANRYAPLNIEILDELEGGRRDELGICITSLRVDGERCDARFQFDEGFHGAVDPDRARDEEFARWSRRSGAVRLIDPDSGSHRVALRLNAKRPLRVRLASDVEAVELVVGEGGETRYTTVEVDLGSTRIDVINNVGSELYRFGFAGDRGFMEPDTGQYDTSTEVFAWCGGAALLRATYLDDVGLFDERLFLYYEDTDLAWRGRLRGWYHVYAPSALVRHHHAQSSGVGSEVFRFHTERNRLLVTARNAPLKVLALALAAEIRHCTKVNLALLVKRPLMLKMPSRSEPRHRRAVLAAIIRGLPWALRHRWSEPGGERRAVHRRWERDKW
jgi:GT2 family glycosyltransferase